MLHLKAARRDNGTLRMASHVVKQALVVRTGQHKLVHVGDESVRIEPSQQFGLQPVQSR